MKTFSIDGTSGGSGWGVARVEFGTIAGEATQIVSISDLGITSVNDYFVLVTFDDSPNHLSQYYAPYNKTTQSFEIENYSDVSVNYMYAIIAKGYGGGS